MCVEKMPFVNFTLFSGFVYHDLKQKNRCPEVCIYTHKSTRIWTVYLNYSKCTWKVSILLYKHHATIFNRVSCNQTLGCLRLYGTSRVSPAQPRINAYVILLQHDWLLFFFLDIIGSQKRIATYNFHII